MFRSLSAAHDSSLDDAGLVRRCEHRVMMFPRYKHDLSLLSADTTQSSAFPASSVSLLDASGEGQSADSFQSSTMTSTDKRDTTGVVNTSLNRNTYHDGRRWVGEGDCSYPLKHTRPESSAGTGGARNCQANSKILETSQHQCCLASSDNDCGKDNGRTDIASNNSSDSLPIIDNLILEPQCDFKHAAATKVKQPRPAARCPQHDPQRAIIYAWREAGSRGSENKKHKHKTALTRQAAVSRSQQQTGKGTLDPSNETYLQRLDSILQKMCVRADRTNPRVLEKISKSTKEAVCSSVNKGRRISPTRKLHACSNTAEASSKLSIHDVIDEIKRVGHSKPRPGTKVDIARPERTVGATRPITRTRCPHRSDQKPVLGEPGGSASTGKEQTRQYSLPTSGSQRYTAGLGSGRTRSKSLSALPRCHTQTLPSVSFPHRAPGKVHSCGAAVNCCKCSTNWGFRKITKQQEEILKHIPNDITPEEIGALMKTVLSIVERRHSLKNTARDGRGQAGLQDVTIPGREDVSKYHIRGQSDSCNTQINLSTKPKTRYSYKTVDMSSNDLLPTTASSQSSRDEADLPSRDVDSGIENKSMNFGSMKLESLGSASGLAGSSLPSDTKFKSLSSTSGVASSSLPCHTKVKCQSSASGLAISSLPCDPKDDARTCSLPLTSLRYSNSTSSGSEYSSRTHNLSTGTLANDAASHKPQSSKQSAVVLPFDDTSFPPQSRRTQRGSEETRGHQPVTPNISPEACRPPRTSPEAGHSPHINPQAGRSPHTNPQAGRSPHINPQAWRPPHTNPQAGRSPHTNPQAGRSPHTNPQVGCPPHTTQNLSSVSADKAASSRHIGWKCPLQTERRTSQTRTDASLGDGNTLPLETGQSQVVRSESALSDGLLYVKSNSATRTLPPRQLPHSSSTSRVILPDDRSAECGNQVHQPNGRKSSSTSLINVTDRAPEARMDLPPCPHEYNQHGCGQGGVLASQRSYTALKQAELDRKISELRLELQRSYQMPYMLQKATSARSGAMTSQTKSTFERQCTFVKNETGDEVNCQCETMDLDALSCSVDTELTNTSLSNRLQELDGEVSSSPDYKWRSNESAIPAGPTLQLNSWSGQCEVRRRPQYTPYTNSAPLHRPDGAGLTSDFTADLAHQPSGLNLHRDGFQAFADDYTWQKHGITAEVCKGTGHIWSDLAPRKFSDYSVGDLDLNRAHFTRQDLLPGADKCFSDKTEKLRNEAENFLCGTGRYMLQGCRATGPESSLQICRNVETHSGLDTARMYSRASCTQLPGCLTQRTSFGVSNVMKLTASVEHRGDFKPAYSFEQYGMPQPSTSLEQPLSFTPYRRFEASGRMNVTASVEQSGNLKPDQVFATTKKVDSASKIDPLDNLHHYNSGQPPSSMGLITQPNKPNNLQTSAQSGHPSSTPESGQQGQANETTTAKCKRSVKVKSTAARSTFRKTNLAQLKQHTQSLLVEVCRRYSTDTYVPSLGTAGRSDLASALEFLQNFSPISQVDVNTQYPVTIGAKEQSLLQEAGSSEQNKSQQVTSAVTDCRNQSGQMSTRSPTNRNTSSGSKAQKTPVKTNLRQGKKMSKTAAGCHRIVKTRVKGHSRFVIQRPNHNNVDTGLGQVTPTKSLFDKQSVQETRATAETQCGQQTVAETTTKSRRRGKNRSVDASGDTVVVDVTSHTSDLHPSDGDDTSATPVDSHSVIWKKYSATSAMPVEVKELGCGGEDKTGTRADTHADTRGNTAQKHPPVQCENHNSPGTSAKIYERKVENSQNDTNTSGLDTQRVASSQCTIERLASAAAVARKMLASHVKHSGRMFSLADCSLTSDSFLDTTTDSDFSLQEVNIGKPGECNYTNSHINDDDYNNSNLHTSTSPGAGRVDSSIPSPLLMILLQVQSCTCRRMSRRRLVQLLHVQSCTCRRMSCRRLVQLLQVQSCTCRRMYHRRVVQLLHVQSCTCRRMSRRRFVQLLQVQSCTCRRMTRRRFVQLLQVQSYTCRRMSRRRFVQLLQVQSCTCRRMSRRRLVQLLQVQSCTCRRMSRRRFVQQVTDNRLQQQIRIDGLATSLPHTSDDNESATPHRPCAKILGELAFQLERRILDYVFGMEGAIRRRFYGYTVNTICQMMNKESKNVCGSDDPLRKSELAFRLKKLLTCLKKVGYNIKKHGDFAQQMVNTYGLLPCPPDSRTIQDFGLHNANCIAHLIDHLACDEEERENLHILLDSLKYLSKTDSRPLFIW